MIAEKKKQVQTLLALVVVLASPSGLYVLDDIAGRATGWRHLLRQKAARAAALPLRAMPKFVWT